MINYLYVIQHGAESLFKVGISKSPAKRLKHLQTGTPIPLNEIIDLRQELPNKEAVNIFERYLHKRLTSYSILNGGGTEWFQTSEDNIRKSISDAKTFLSDYINTANQAKLFTEMPYTALKSEITNHNDDIKSIYSNLIAVKGKIDALTYKKEYLENKLKATIGMHKGIYGLATWNWQPYSSFDKSLLESFFPELHQQIIEKCTRSGVSRVFRLR